MSSKIESIQHASHVHAFKNGYCLIVKQFSIPAHDAISTLELMNVPENPVYGTFSVKAAHNVKIYSIRSKTIDHFVETKCKTIEELIKANVEQEDVELLTKGFEANPTWLKGKIYMDIEEEEESPSDAKTSFMSTSNQQKTVIVETADQETIAFPLESIISIRGKHLKTSRKKCMKKSCLSMNYENPTGKQAVGFMKYLTFGITWIPSYEVDLMTSTESNTRMLRLSLKCTLLNDTEDIDVDDLSCIVGHPNLLSYVNVVDPLLNTSSAKEFLYQVDNENSETTVWDKKYSANRFRTRMNTANDAMGYSDDEDKNNDTGNGQDFHLYKFKNVTLRKGEKVSLPIFNTKLPYKDIYHCIINPKQRKVSSSTYKTNNNASIVSTEVWHAVEFDNKSNHILTTAPVLITQDKHQLICQETLPFTMKNSPVFIHLTKAPAIRVTHEEKLADDSKKTDTVDSVEIFKKTYMKEEWIGSIKVVNGIPEAVSVVIKIQLDGDISDYSLSPRIDSVEKGKDNINRIHEITWDTQLKPHETKMITYTRIFHRSIKGTANSSSDNDE